MALPGPARLMQMVKKGPWSEMEDKRLLDLVSYHGAESWMDISKEHGSRNAKQCRERYHQNLKSSINRGPITPEEGVAIERYHAEKGPKWAEIARALGGRSDNQVKNWYNGQKNRRTKMSAHGGQSMPHGTQQSLSAVRPVDTQLLQQRGHMNPYSRRSIDHQSKLSPTTSQISEAPSLISDASSTSPAISPSPNTAYPAQPNLASSILSSWTEDSLRPVLPPLCTAIGNTVLGTSSHMSVNIPPIAPPRRQSESEMNQYLGGNRPQHNDFINEPQQYPRYSQTVGPPSQYHSPSPQAHSSSANLSPPDHYSSPPSEHSMARIHPPSGGHTVFYSLLEQDVPSDRVHAIRQSPPPQLRAASTRGTCMPCRYAPYRPPCRLPVNPGGGERTAKDRMKLNNILEP